MKLTCPRCSVLALDKPNPGSIIRIGFFYRTSDKSYVRRWRCRSCNRSFFTATGDPCFGQKKRHLNSTVFVNLCSTNSQRRTAKTLSCNRKTVVRKFLFLAAQAKVELDQFNRERALVTHVQFDDMESHEHSKLKPVSMTVAVTKDRYILGVAVAQMPCARSMVEISKKKYGPRKDKRQSARNKLLVNLLPFVRADAHLRPIKTHTTPGS